MISEAAKKGTNVLKGETKQDTAILLIVCRSCAHSHVPECQISKKQKDNFLLRERNKREPSMF